LCEHLEVSDFGTYTVDVGAGRLQKVMLLRCSFCNALVTSDGHEVPSRSIVSREGISRSNLRTIVALLNSGTYQELEDLFATETSEGMDPAKIMNEIVALGLKQYRKTLS